jgi:ABC-2 type transport system permease protein
MRRILSQCKKEISQFRRDKLTVALAYVLPLIAMVIYGYATRLESKDITIAIYNYDTGSLSRDFIATLTNNNQFILVKTDQSNRNPYSLLDQNKAKAALVIPPEFSRKILNKRQANIQAIVDATDVNNARVIKNSILASCTYFLNTEFAQSKSYKSPQALVVPQIRIWFNPGRKESLYVAPGAVAVFLWIFPCLLATLAMSREKEQGTILQLYASSISSVELIAGKALAYVLIGLSQAIFLIGFSTILFQLEFIGSFIAFIIALLLYITASICFGLLAGTRASTQSAAVQIVATTGFTTALLLSGFLYPLRNISFPLSLISNIVPARYFVEAARDFFVRGSDFGAQIFIIVALLICATFLFIVPTKILKNMQLDG